MPAYRRSPALHHWSTSRRSNIDELRRARSLVSHAGPGSGAGRPPQAGTQQLNEAMVLRVVAEFQGFVRDLFDLATITMIRGSGCAPRHEAQLILAATRGRAVDRRSPNLEAIKGDAERLGITDVRSRLAGKNLRHSDDAKALTDLVGLRNALAHDNQDQLRNLSRSGVRPTMLFVSRSQSVLGRHARALDQVVWNHLTHFFPATDPWSS